MDLDTLLTIVCAIGTVVAYIAYRILDANVRFTYHDQRIPNKETKKKEKRR